MKLLKITLPVILFLLVTLQARSQYDPGYTHYMFNEFFINPGYTGAKDALSINLLGRLQWSGFSGAPRTFALNAHTPLSNQHFAVGAGVLYDKIGIGSHTAGYINIAGRLVFPKSILSLGIQLSAGGQDYNYGELKNVTDDISSDPMLMKEPSKFIPNAGFGLYYYSSRFYAGLSIPRLLNNFYIKNENKRFEFKELTYYFSTGYVFDINRNFQLMPSAMLKITQGAKLQYDLGVMSLLWENIWLGLNYRSSHILAPIVGFQLNRTWRINYSYEINTESVPRKSLGASHEISIMYTFDFIHKRVVSPRLF